MYTRAEHHVGVLDMTFDEFRAELKKPVATIRLNMDAMRDMGAGFHIKIGNVESPEQADAPAGVEQ